MVGRLLSLGAFVLVVAGCSGTQTSPVPHGPNAGARRAVTDAILHTFASSPDGAAPRAGLLNVNGTLYGTTSVGGLAGYGTVFKIDAGGKEVVLHSFSGGTTDGAYPYGGLIEVNGSLYGTAELAGSSACYSAGCGMVFKITTSGKESTVYSFRGGSADGAYPQADLIYAHGALFGTTVNGGPYNAGTVFKLTTSGKENVLHAFTGGADGINPLGALVDLDGTLYGTTEFGGTGSCKGIQEDGCGIVFKVTASGKESTLFDFPGNSYNGDFPFSALSVVRGALYGTTLNGGTKNAGTVFTITPSGKESVLYSFNGGTSDGSGPSASLLAVKGLLYGTTSQGGLANSGTVFKITTAGRETILYSFAGYPTDGALPMGALITMGGKLYGTTDEGGDSVNCSTLFSSVGCGIVFSLPL